MKENYSRAKQWFEGVVPRERLLIVGAALAFFYLLWDFIFIQPLDRQTKILVTKETAATKNIQTKQAEVDVLSAMAKKDPASAVKQEIQVIKRQIQEVDMQLNALSTGMVSPEQLPIVLHDVLKRNTELTLLSLTTLPSKKIEIEVGKDVEGQDGSLESQPDISEEVTLYRQGVTMVLNGKFVDLARYLQDLEAGQWKFYWDTLSYTVDQYPNANIELTVYALSSGMGVFDEE